MTLESLFLSKVSLGYLHLISFLIKLIYVMRVLSFLSFLMTIKPNLFLSDIGHWCYDFILKIKKIILAILLAICMKIQFRNIWL